MHPEEIWVKHYGVARVGCARGLKRDIGPHKSSRDTAAPLCKTDWIKKRRHEATTLSRKVCGSLGQQKIDHAAVSDVGDAWTPRHEKELAFQQHKEQHRKREAYNFRHLLDNEGGPGLAADAADHRAHDRTLAVQMAHSEIAQATKLRDGMIKAHSASKCVAMLFEPVKTKQLCFVHTRQNL